MIVHRLVTEPETVLEERLSFVIETEVTPSLLEDMLIFIHRKLLLPNEERFGSVEFFTGPPGQLSFTALNSEGGEALDVEMRADENIQVEMASRLDVIPDKLLNQLREDIVLAVQLFEELVRETTLYFAWLEGEEARRERVMEKKKSIIGKIFSSGMYFLFIISIAASILLFLFLGSYAPVAVVSLQLLLTLVSDKLVARAGDWEITHKNPIIHLFQYHLPSKEYRRVKERFSEEDFEEIKLAVYDKTLGGGRPLTCEAADEVFSKHGLQCKVENMLARKINIYEIVEKVSEKFGLPIPRIIVANTLAPNAAASGPGPSRGVLLVTTGLLVQLEEDEVLNILGHEFSHLKNRDPFILFGLTAAEYLLRFYVLLKFFATSFWFGYLYLTVALTAVYFAVKFFEGRADLEAAAKIGQPKVLAEGLEKIGFRRLPYQRSSPYRIQSWIRWDPHPPLYFRINRLENLEKPEEIRHLLLRSAKDNLQAFMRALNLA